jgi:opine dehydrogenase
VFILKVKITVFGADSYGQTMAADLTLAGFKVNLLELPEYQQAIAPVQKLGGIHLSGETQALISGKTGFAKPNMITTDVEEALKDVKVIFVTVPVTDYEDRFKAIAPYLEDGQIVNFNTYGYWPSLRVANILEQMGKENVILTESPAPTYSARGKDGHVTSVWIRRKLPLAAFPAKKRKEAIDALKAIYPNFESAKNVLQINFENMNLLAHPGIAICNIGYFDRAEEKGETVDFYSTGNTVHAGILSEAQDRERIEVCQAYGVPYTSLREHIIRYYASSGKTVQEAIKNAKMYQGIPPLPANIWDQWLSTDLPLSHVPFVILAELAGISTPIHRAIIEIVGAVLETDFWETGLTLDKLGMEGLTIEEVIRYVTEGEIK